MSAFTALSAWDHLQDRTAANQIVLAYSERRQCVGDSAIDPLDAGDNAQDTAFWKGMQDWVTTNCVHWVNDYDFSTSTEYDNPGEIAYTIATFKTQSELTGGSSGVVGFRRATTWPTDWTDYEDAAYSYGPIEAGDIRGPWIYEDLQKAFDALRWTYAAGWESGFLIPLLTYPSKTPIELTASNPLEGTAIASGQSTSSDAYDAAVANWSTQPGGGYYHFVQSAISGSGSNWSCSLYRVESDADFTKIPEHLEHEAEGYLLAATMESIEVFEDVDSHGFEFKKLLNAASFAKAETESRSIPAFGSTAAPAAPSAADGQLHGVETNYCAVLIIKWDFSRTL